MVHKKETGIVGDFSGLIDAKSKTFEFCISKFSLQFHLKYTIRKENCSKKSLCWS
jgi:hypothetical protein